MPSITSLTIAPLNVTRPTDSYARVPMEQVELIADRGIDGDKKARGGKRQINFMLAETMTELAAEGFLTAPGQLGEQMIIAGLPEGAMPDGTRLRIGETAVIEITLPRTGCDRFERIQGQRKSRARGRLGYLAKVIVSGPIAIGSTVEIIEPAPIEVVPQKPIRRPRRLRTPSA